MLLLVAVLYIADHQTAPYNPVIGGRDQSQSNVGQIMYHLGLLYQGYWLDQGIYPNTEYFFNRLVHVSPRFIQTLDLGYIREFLLDTYSTPFPEGTVFSQDFTRERITHLPNWVTDKIQLAQYRDTRNQHIEVATFGLKPETEFEAVFSPKVVGTLTAPTYMLAWPNAETRSENTAYLGTNPIRSHGNGTATALSLDPNLRIVFGGGWHTNSELFPYKDIDAAASLRYGLVTPNDKAKSATGSIFWDSDGVMTVHNPMAGDLLDQVYTPFALLLDNGTATLLQGREIIPYLDASLKLTNAVLTQVAYGIPHTDRLDQMNAYLQTDYEEEKSKILDEIQRSLPEEMLPGLDVVWMTTVLVRYADGTEETVASFALNKSEESESTSGKFKVTASLGEALSYVKKNLEPKLFLQQQYIRVLKAQQNTLVSLVERLLLLLVLLHTQRLMS